MFRIVKRFLNKRRIKKERELIEYKIQVFGWKLEDYVWKKNTYIHRSVA